LIFKLLTILAWFGKLLDNLARLSEEKKKNWKSRKAMRLINCKKCSERGCVLAIPCLLLMACQQISLKEKTDVNWHCETFRPINWSQNDTLKTKEQIVEHNAVWDSLCEI